MPSTATDGRPDGQPVRAPDTLRVEPPGGQARRLRWSHLALGLAVLLAGALVGQALLSRVGDREPVLALSEPLERGETLTAAHLEVVGVGTDAPLRLVEASRRSELLGRTATADLEAGTLLAPEHLTAGPTAGAGQTVVGLALAPGAYPTARLGAGDRVRVVRIPDPQADDGLPTAVLAEDAVVLGVEALSETAKTRLVEVALDDALAAEVLALAAEDRIRLGLAGG